MGAPGAVADETAERFQMERVGEDVLRLDRETGRVELCAPSTPTFACRIVVEGVVDRAAATTPDGAPASGALLSENQALRAENAALKRRLQMIRALVEGVEGEMPPMEGGGPRRTADRLGLPSFSRQELDEALDMTDYAVRRFRDIFNGLADDPANPAER